MKPGGGQETGGEGHQQAVNDLDPVVAVTRMINRTPASSRRFVLTTVQLTARGR
jgi:hypothetical protein